MVVKLKEKSQVTIPAAVVREIGLKQGDSFDVSVLNGQVVLTPVVYVSREEQKKIAFAREMDSIYRQMRAGNEVKRDLIEV